FVQGSRSMARAQGGLGIGLTLVRSLVEMHGGTVGVHSAGPGRGSEFTVRLPLASGQRSTPAGVDLPEGAAPILPSCRILVVDDNRDSADSLAMLLRARGSDIRVAYDGHRAIEEAQAFIPDLVLLDIGLPDMSGYEVARRLRQDARLRHIVLVAQTGWGQAEDRQ